jgi:hypothetical protein
VRLVGIAEIGCLGGPVADVAPVGPLRSLMQPGPAHHPLRPDADVLGEQPLQPAHRQAGHGGELVNAGQRRITIAQDDVADAVLTAVEANAELFRTYQGFADPMPVPASASALDRALAQSGRDPAWAPIG